MAALKTETNLNIKTSNNLMKDYHWFYSCIYTVMIKAIKEFFQSDFEIRFMGLANEENILFYGDEYFVNKISINKHADFKMKISSNVTKILLDTALGASEQPFNLNQLTDIEAMLIKAFAEHIYKKIENNLNKAELNKKVIQNSKEINLTFYIKSEKIHSGKIIITIPDYVIPEIKEINRPENFSINDFKRSYVNLKLCIGKSKITLSEIKSIEDGDVIVLEDSNINTMSVIWEQNEVKFKINPDPSLIISVDNNGGNEMEEETSTKPQNMWDSILVDIVAEFDNVKLTLGELKQISEGLVIDVGSVYENKVKLRVENQVVATGELVILNDRYGVRIDAVNKTKETAKEPAKQKATNIATTEEETANSAQEEKPQAKKPARPAAATKAKQNNNGAENADGKENFDYSDFEIEDESI